MNIKKRIVCLLCVVIFMFSFTLSVYASYTPSDWAQKSVSLAESYKIIPDNTSYTPYTQNITRSEFCRFAVGFYSIFSSKQKPDSFNSQFVDTTDPDILYAADIGIIAGRGDSVFSPDDFITRQEMCTVIMRLLKICDIDVSVSEDVIKDALSSYQDHFAIKDWAINPFAFCIKNGIIKGMSETQLWPDYHTTREQAIVIIYRCFDIFATNEQKENAYTPMLYADGDYETLETTIFGDGNLVSYKDRNVSIEFKEANAPKYKVDIYLDESNFWYSNEDVYVKTLYTTKNSFTFENVRIGKTYKVNIYSDTDEYICSLSFYVSPLHTLAQKQDIVFSHGEPTSKEQADALIEKITVNVWRMGADGIKSPSRVSLSVHKSIANITKSAFEEIYNSKAQFPIKDVGAYTWRDMMSSGRYSHHNYGTAIDINSNENYCIYKDGSYIGVGWFPGDNAYSIAADSDIVSIFSKYGFIWGGDEWSNPKDYMHFSYLEL